MSSSSGVEIRFRSRDHHDARVVGDDRDLALPPRLQEVERLGVEPLDVEARDEIGQPVRSAILAALLAVSRQQVDDAPARREELREPAAHLGLADELERLVLPLPDPLEHVAVLDVDAVRAAQDHDAAVVVHAEALGREALAVEVDLPPLEELRALAHGREQILHAAVLEVRVLLPALRGEGVDLDRLALLVDQPELRERLRRERVATARREVPLHAVRLGEHVEEHEDGDHEPGDERRVRAVGQPPAKGLVHRSTAIAAIRSIARSGKGTRT